MSSILGYRGFTRKIRLIPAVFSANGRNCSSRTPSSRSAARNADRPFQLLDGDNRFFRRGAKVHSGNVAPQQFGNPRELFLADRTIVTHDVRQQQPVAAAVRAVRGAADGVLHARAPAPRRRWKTPGPPAVAASAMPSRASRSLPLLHRRARCCPTSAIAFSARHVAHRMPALVDAALARRQRESLRCRRRCRLRWRASGRRCRCRRSPWAGSDTVSSGSTTATRGRR